MTSRVELITQINGVETPISATNVLPIGVISDAGFAEITGTASSAAAFTMTPSGSVDTTGYSTIVVQPTAIGNAGNRWTLEVSTDNTNWQAVTLRSVTSVSNVSSGAATIAPSLTVISVLPVSAKWFRVRMSTYGGGTDTLIVQLRNGPVLGPLVVEQGTGGGTWTVNHAVRTSGGLTTAKVKSAGSTNATSVKASVGQLYSYRLFNKSLTIIYLKLFNKATAPTVGTDVPQDIISIPAGGGVESPGQSFGIAFATGIAYCIVTGADDSDATAVAANDVIGALYYA